MKKPASLLKQIGVLALLVLVYLGNEYLGNGTNDRPSGTTQNQTEQSSRGSSQSSGATRSSNDDTNLIIESFEAQRSDVWVQASGTVDRVLPDDNEGSRHQRFLVALRTGHTILIAHNIDLAPKVPLERGDTVEFRGEYEWNDRGGVVHWTHHDPRGRKKGGWISHRKQTYE
ncbi:MAG: DUF3465 domain-containing protein [Gammaproteobacteria bacterium]